MFVTGGTGLVGTRLLQKCTGQVIVATRRPERMASERTARTPAAESGLEIRALKWDAASIIPAHELEGVDAVVHLAGDSVAEGRWNAEKKQRIRDSRVLGTRCLVKSLAGMARPPKVLVSASAVGYYGHRPREILTETSKPGNGFLPEVCQEWEAEAKAAMTHGIRVCCLRTGIVLDTQGGALATMLPIYRWGLGGPMGSGGQYFPWIHLEDLVRMIGHCLDSPTISGPVNAVAPTAITQRQFASALGKSLGRPAFLPAPKFGLRLLLGEFANSLFDSQHVSPKVALDSGFTFRYGTIDAALDELLGSGAQPATA